MVEADKIVGVINKDASNITYNIKMKKESQKVWLTQMLQT